jgi:hypothetical protein
MFTVWVTVSVPLTSTVLVAPATVLVTVAPGTSVKQRPYVTVEVMATGFEATNDAIESKMTQVGKSI